MQAYITILGGRLPPGLQICRPEDRAGRHRGKRYIIPYITMRRGSVVMEIETQALTTCEVAADGGAILLGFVDAGGQPATIRLSLNQVGAVAMTLPGLIDKELQT